MKKPWALNGRRPPDWRAKPRSVRCAECGELVAPGLAVTFNEKKYHALVCFEAALVDLRKRLELAAAGR